MATPLNKPIVKFTTPNIRDIYFVEFVGVHEPYYSRFEYGDPYPDQDTYPGAVLTYRTPIETGGGEDQRARMVWCSAPSAQDVYNAKLDFTEQNASYPIYTRSYLQRRTNPFVPATRQLGLQSLVDLTWVAGGINYTGDSYGHIALIFTGGGGSGASGFGVVENGVITAGYLTNGGTGFTSAPTISALGGAGANIAAVLQPATALLISEIKKPADGELGTIWDSVIRLYETLPGPVVRYDSGYEEETGAFWARYRQRVVQGSSIPAFGVEYPASSGFYVIDAGIKKDQGQGNAGTMEVWVMEIPDGRIEYRRGSYPTPDFFVPISSYAYWPIPSAYPGIPGGPYQNRTDGKDQDGADLAPDVNSRGTYELQVAAPASPFKDTITYFLTPPGALPDAFACVSQPGRFLNMIDRNTIHAAVTAIYIGAVTVVIENLRASTPASYTDGTTVIDADQKQWKGPFWKRVVTTVEFPALPNQ